MKQKKQVEVERQHDKKWEQKQHEIHKAVAQAWHSHFNNARIATCEFDARRRNFQSKSSRFKLEVMNKMKAAQEVKVEWDFNESLWDSYEIVAISKRLENGLVMDYDFNHLSKTVEYKRLLKKKESRNSLRNLFNVMSSRRFNDVEASHQES